MKTNPPTTSDTALHLTREFKAPLAHVYSVWSNMDHARKWWGPEGCETLELTADLRVGGKYRWRLRTPDGAEMTATGEYREIEPREKIVYTWHWEDDPEWENHDSVVTVVFIAKDAGTTELRLSHENLPSLESRDNHTGGWNSALDRFARLVSGR
jgi:uncharacterized protein YndB with AHSA1/START domain